VARIEVGETHRAQLPLETFPISSGLIGGIAGGIAMVIPAEIYGIVRFHSIWYVVNLLGGAGVGDWVNPTMEQMSHFRLSAFVTANIIQGLTTLLVGLLYGAMLPIWPKHPILLGGIIAPAAWTGLLHGVLGIVNPFLDQRIDWWSFAASQVIFGLVAGYVVTKLGRIKRLQQVPLAVRLGLETPGLRPRRDGEEPKR
jgi:VIT1/CCC1 family predicted Fe2+/Mn2+ transporter